LADFSESKHGMAAYVDCFGGVGHITGGGEIGGISIDERPSMSAEFLNLGSMAPGDTETDEGQSRS